jgi:hypothetical protein
MNFKRPIYNRSRLSAGDSPFTVGLHIYVCVCLCVFRATVRPACWACNFRRAFAVFDKVHAP